MWPFEPKIKITSVSNPSPKWDIDSVKVSGIVDDPSPSDKVVVNWGDGQSSPPQNLSGDTFGPLSHTYGPGATSSNPNNMYATLVSAGGSSTDSERIPINVRPHDTKLILNSINDVSAGTNVTAVGNLIDTDLNVGINNEPITFTDNNTNSVLPSINTQGITITDASPLGINVNPCPSPECTPNSGSTINVIHIHNLSEITLPDGTIGVTFYLQNMSDTSFSYLVTQNNGVKFRGSGAASDGYVTLLTVMAKSGIQKIKILSIHGTSEYIGISEIKTINPDSDPKILLDEGFDALKPNTTYPMVQILQGSFSAVAKSPTSPSPALINVQAHFGGDANYSMADSASTVYNTAQSSGAFGVGGGGEPTTQNERGTTFISNLCSAAHLDTSRDHICNDWHTSGIPYHVGTTQFLYRLAGDPLQKTIYIRAVIANDTAIKQGGNITTALNNVKNLFNNAQLVPPALCSTCHNGIGMQIEKESLPASAVDKIIHVWSDLDTSKTNDFSSIKAIYFGNQTERPMVSGTQTGTVVSGLSFRTSGLTLNTPSTTINAGVSGTNPPAGSNCGQWVSGNLTINQIVTFSSAVTISTPISTPTYDSSGSTTLVQQQTPTCGTVTIDWNAIIAQVSTKNPGTANIIQNITLTVPFTTNGAVANLGVPAFTTALTLGSGSGAIVSPNGVNPGADSPIVVDTLEAAKAQAYHFVLFADCVNDCSTTPTGVSEQKGNDFIVALGPYNPILSGVTTTNQAINYYAGTFMHELGHNLDLKHGGPVKIYTPSNPLGVSGGDFTTNCKPNYPSVMSYSRQLDTYLKDSAGVNHWVLNYSGGQFSSINEQTLVESPSGLTYHGHLDANGNAPWIVWTNNTGQVSWPKSSTSSSYGTLDWDNEDVTSMNTGGSGLHTDVNPTDPDSNTLSVNLNNFNIPNCQYTSTSTLSDHNDWNNLYYNFTSTGSFMGAHGNPDHNSEITVPIYYEMVEQASSRNSPPVPTSLVNITLGSGASIACSVEADNCFEPSTIIIPTSKKVLWQNNDTVSHTITSGRPSDLVAGTQFDSGLIPPGGTFHVLFNNTGTYYYFDEVHPWMIGKVQVEQ